MQNKKALIAIAAILVLFAVGGTFAYFFYNESFSNVFHLSAQKAEYVEVFDSPSDWTPCTETPKKFVVKNTGTAPIDVRVSMNEYWERLNSDRSAATNERLPLRVNNQDIAIKNQSNNSDWSKRGDYYYYRTSLAPGETTKSFIDSVTFSCTANEEYSSARYHLVLHAETIQSDARAQDSSWN